MSVPESVVDDGALVELVSRVEQLGGDDGGVAEAGGLAAHLLTVDQDVLSMGPGGRSRVGGISLCTLSLFDPV